MHQDDTKSESSGEGIWGDVMLDDDTLSGVFDFKRAKYTHVKRYLGGLAEPIYYSLLLVVGALLLFGSVLIARMTKGYDLFSDVFPDRIKYWREALRWVVFGGAAMMLNGLFGSLAYWMPIVVCRNYILKGRDVPERVSTGLVFFINIKAHLARLCTFVALYLLAVHLFPAPATALNSSPSDDSEKQTENLTIKNFFRAFQEKSVHETYAQYPWQILASRLLLAASIGSFLFLLERILLVRIAIHFHARTLQTEIENNKKALQVIKGLKRKVLGTNVHVKHDDLGPALYERLCKPGATSVVSGDLAQYMTESDCLFFFSLIDINQNGDLTRDEFSISISNVYRQRMFLQKSIFDENQILRGLDNILRKIIVVACVVLAFALLDPQLSTQITTLGTTLISATILFHGTAAIAFQSIVFIVVSHPFDVGDMVVIGEDTLIVQEIGLWSCAFVSTEDGKTVYLTNHNMREMYIANLKRSPPMDEDFTIKVHPETSQETLDRLEACLRRFVEERKRDYTNTVIKSVKLVDRDRMELVIGLNHKSNFQNLDLKNKRSKEFMLHLKDSLASLNIKLSPPW